MAFITNICRFMNESLPELKNLTQEQYTNGTWAIDNINEDELFNVIAPSLSDLIKGIDIRKILNSEGDDYEKIKVATDDESLKNNGIKITRKDYYKNLKTHCISFKYTI